MTVSTADNFPAIARSIFAACIPSREEWEAAVNRHADETVFADRRRALTLKHGKCGHAGCFDADGHWDGCALEDERD